MAQVKTKRNIPNIKIEDAKIIFKNFQGKQDKYNREGSRDFSVIIFDPEMAEDLKADGWNIKPYEPKRDEFRTEEPQHILRVSVRFDVAPPKIVLMSEGDIHNRIRLNESSVDQLDELRFVRADVAISPYQWEAGGDSGVKAYLKTLYVVVEEPEPDEFEHLYDEEFPEN